MGRTPIEPLDPTTDPVLATDLLALQVAAYRVEAELIGSDAIPALHETPTTLVAAGLSWLGCRDGDGLLGAPGLVETPDAVDLDRLVVAPRAFRRGIGRRDNVAARALYVQAGFRSAGEHEVVPGSWTVSYTLEPSTGGGATRGTGEPQLS